MTIAMIGDRVQLHPATDAWIRGDRFGTVIRAVKVRGSGAVKVRGSGAVGMRVHLDKSDRVVTLHTDNILKVVPDRGSDLVWLRQWVGEEGLVAWMNEPHKALDGMSPRHVVEKVKGGMKVVENLVHDMRVLA